MPVDQTTRPYDAGQSTDNPTAVAPGWAKTVVTLAGIVGSVLVAIQGANLFPPDSPVGKAVVAGIGIVGAVVAAMTFIIGETAKEKAKSEGAARIAEAKVVAQSNVEVAEITGQAPAVAAPASDSTKTVTETTTETGTTG